MMQRHFIYALKTVFFFSFVFGVESSVEKLKCYQCEVRESALCTDEYLQTCPDTQAFDNCITRIYKTKKDGQWIQKKCALGPCSLRDQSQSIGLGLDHCDRSQDEYDCISCCKENGCNTGRAGVCQPILNLIITIAIWVQVFEKYRLL